MPLALISAAAVFPIWLIAQPNPGWRLVPSLLALSAVLGTVALCARAGGKSWARHFAFPILFMLTAVPWPGLVEETLVQGLMRFVAGVTVALLNFAGLSAMQRGNLSRSTCRRARRGRSMQWRAFATDCIDVGASFWRTLSAQTRRTRRARRRWFRCGVAHQCRSNRLSILSAGHDGLDAIDRWHDPAGYMVVTVSIVIIALLAEWLSVKHSTKVKVSVASPAHPLRLARESSSPPGWFSSWRAPKRGISARQQAIRGNGHSPCRRERKSSRCLRIRSPCSAAIRRVQRPGAMTRGPTGRHSFSNGSLAADRTALLAQVHRPEVCLPSTGFTEAGSRRTLRISAAGFDLAFESLHFRDPRGEDAFVFYCPWEIIPGQPGRNAVFSDSTRTTSFRRVWQRERVIGPAGDRVDRHRNLFARSGRSARCGDNLAC
jgi:hypothetical protein